MTSEAANALPDENLIRRPAASSSRAEEASARSPTEGAALLIKECLRRTAAAEEARIRAEANAANARAADGGRDNRERKDADRRNTESMSVLAHELRSPLAAIRYAVAVMRRGCRNEAAVHSVQDAIDNQVTLMLRLVDDLSEVSRAANGKIHLERAPLDLAALVRDAAETSRPSVEARKHRLTVRVPQEPLPVNADRLRLSQVLTNLLNNAAKYTPPGGALSLSAEREEDEAVVRVCDNGVGISAETLPRIFDMFMQVDQSLGLSQGGLGIGLTLVQRFVEMHGGSVHAASGGANCGSEFTVRLPLLLASRITLGDCQ
ncbi:MAG: HAMP domain-containing histidine kinase [Planctomycetes bacterium]|nr:HAMP domain-containing histidine kinase [Planctomycetota bacterium]